MMIMIRKSCANLCSGADWLSKSRGYWTPCLLQRFTPLSQFTQRWRSWI